MQTELETEEKHFTVRKLVRSALNEYNDEMFLVWWEGYPEPDGSDPTFWEPESSFDKELILEFRSSESYVVPEQPKGRSKKKREKKTKYH